MVRQSPRSIVVSAARRAVPNRSPNDTKAMLKELNVILYAVNPTGFMASGSLAKSSSNIQAGLSKFSRPSRGRDKPTGNRGRDSSCHQCPCRTGRSEEHTSELQSLRHLV